MTRILLSQGIWMEEMIECNWNDSPGYLDYEKKKIQKIVNDVKRRKKWNKKYRKC